MNSTNIHPLNEQMQPETLFLGNLSTAVNRVMLEVETVVKRLLETLLANRHILLKGKTGMTFSALLASEMIAGSHGHELDEPNFYLTVSDSSGRKEMKIVLEETRQRLQALFNQALDAILLADDQAQYVDANPAACTMLGYNHNELLRMGLWNILPEMNKESGQELWRDFIAAGQQSGEITLLHKDGRLIEAEYQATANIVPGIHLSILRDITERKQAEQEKNQLLETITDQREQLRVLAGKLVDLQEVERKALARELHDQIGQNLTGLSLNLNFIQSQLVKIVPDMPEPVRTTLHDSLRLVERTTERVQDVMAELRPPVLEDFGLVATLQWYADRLSHRNGFTVTILGSEPEPRLSGTLEFTLFRIAQEALNNVIKHAQAKSVVIKVEADSLVARLTVIDDGIGFDITRWSDPTERRSWGLLTMIERAEVLGGYCHIETQLGQGTRVIVEIPY